MALYDTHWYCSSVGWTAVTAWATGQAKAAGALIRQTAPAVASERAFVCIVAGTTHATTEPTWTITRGAKTTDNTVTWQECTGASAVNGDVTNTPNWTSVKNTVITLGQIIKRDNAASYQICSTSGTAGNAAEPGFSDTAGTTTADNTVTWTSLGVVGNFTGGQGPHARVDAATASTWAAVGNTVFVKSDHAETRAAALNLAATASTTANPIKLICHDGANYPPTSANLTTGATVTTTGAFTISYTGVGLYCYGLTFEVGSGANALNYALGTFNGSILLVFDNCRHRMVATGAGRIHVGQSGAVPLVKFVNGTTIKFGATTQGINTLSGSGVFVWRGGSIEAGSSVPAVLIRDLSSTSTNLSALIEGCDLSAVTTGNALTSASSGAGGARYIFKDCKLAAGVTVSNTPIGPAGPRIDLVRCDSTGVNTRVERYHYEGTETTETTIVRTGGASDGTTAHARKIVTTASASFFNPFEAMAISVWNESTSSITLTLYGIWGGGAVPSNDEFWIEVEYLNDSGSPQGSFISSRKADVLATAAGLTSDASTWGGSTTAFKTSVTFTPDMKGPITVRVFAAKVSSTFYFDPKVVIT